MMNNSRKDISAKALKSLERLYPFASKTAMINGRRYHYVDEGNGDPVIMVHGNPTWSFYFRSLIAGLKDNFRAIAPDHIGCGLSEKPADGSYGFALKNRVADLEAFVAHLNLDKKITLVVHDWGGMIGMAWAVQYPEKIARIVVLNTAAFLPPEEKPIPLRLQLIRNLPWFGAPAVLGANLFARAAIYMAPKKRLTKDVKNGLLAPYNRPKNRLATLKFVQDIPLAKKDPSYALVRDTDGALNRLAGVPMMILWGERDFVFDMDYFHQWRNRFPPSIRHLLSGCRPLHP